MLVRPPNRLSHCHNQVSDWTLVLPPAHRGQAAGTSDGATGTAIKTDCVEYSRGVDVKLVSLTVFAKPSSLEPIVRPPGRVRGQERESLGSTPPEHEFRADAVPHGRPGSRSTSNSSASHVSSVCFPSSSLVSSDVTHSQLLKTLSSIFWLVCDPIPCADVLSALTLLPVTCNWPRCVRHWIAGSSRSAAPELPEGLQASGRRPQAAAPLASLFRCASGGMLPR